MTMLGKLRNWALLAGGCLVVLTLLLWSDQTLIVPGRGVGRYKLQQRRNSLQNSYVEPATRGLILTFSGEQLDVISVLDEKYHTAEGLRIGSTTNSLISAYGKPDRIDGDFWDYDRRGLQFCCKSGTVSFINVISPTNR
jgi:hypothetical protein